jgi:exosortase/archaeosortase family protein
VEARPVSVRTFDRPSVTGVARPIGTLIIAASIALLVLPFFTTFGELLTQLAIAGGLDAALGAWIAPAEAQAVRGLLLLLGLRSNVDGQLLAVGDGVRGTTLFISWNCVGWQTLFFLAVSMLTGLQGEYTLRSRIETVLLGVAGIVALNVLRITIVALVAFYLGRLPAVIVHDYGSVLMTVGFLMGFWAFAFHSVLERRFDDGRTA